MSCTTLEQWKQWAKDYEHLPYIGKTANVSGLPITWEPLWEQGGKPSFVLESGKSGRYTYVGCEAISTITGKGDRARIVNVVGNRGEPPEVEERELVGSPLANVKHWMDAYRTPVAAGAPPFVGGCAGYWSYDVARSLEKLPDWADDDLQLPEYDFMLVSRLYAYDRQEQTLYCSVHVPVPFASREADFSEQLERLFQEAEQEAERMAEQWRLITDSAASDARALSRRSRYEAVSLEEALAIDVEAIPGIEIAFSREHYMEAVRQIQRYIAQGDVFQVNLSVRQSRQLGVEPEWIYEWLRLLNPSPYMGLLRFPDYAIVSGSPELLVRSVDGVVETRPIAGTRPRGSDEREDKRLADELIGNEKERAEHIMLVDLLRNDLGRVSKYGTVRVTDLMVVERYSHVMHIVSHIQGKLAEGKDAFDAIAATFPGGTITGAPKIRTMEIIEELEPVRRGPYTGSIGWIDYNGNMELNIVIRTLLVRGGVGYVQSGAGIVIDSDPEKEFVESLNKAKALWKAILYSEQAGG